ncbi:MAG: cytoplasmic protein [Tenacibaculum sp.]|nr:cytoplasmic protein [Tenacibaculum sp.]
MEKIKAHKHSSNHYTEIMQSETCGCFHCLEIFKPTRIYEWIDDGQCAMCPECAIDSVIGSKSGYPITKEFLTEMRNYWFGED